MGGYDHLTVNGIDYGGSSLESQNVYDQISWTSNSWMASGGWKICFDEPQSTTEPPTMGPHPNWTITGIGCHTADESCIESNNFPGNYGNSESCQIDLHHALHMSVQSFETESYYDHLTVNGLEYNGVNHPEPQDVYHQILWTSDYIYANGGWRICFDEPEYSTESFD